MRIVLTRMLVEARASHCTDTGGLHYWGDVQLLVLLAIIFAYGGNMISKCSQLTNSDLNITDTSKKLEVLLQMKKQWDTSLFFQICCFE